MNGESAEKDTIPRLAHIGYLLEGLRALSDGVNLDGLRKRLIDYSRRRSELERAVSRTGYHSGKRLRVTDSYTYWSNAKDVVSELMRLGFVKESTVPSKRKYFDFHRETKYELTEDGHVMANSLLESEHGFKDKLFEAMYRKHPHLRAFIERLSKGSLGIPIYRIKRTLRRYKNQGTSQELVKEAIRWFSEQGKRQGLSLDINGLVERLSNRVRKVENKSKLVNILNEYAQEAFIHAYGLHFDNITFEHLMNLTKQFLVSNYTFHLRQFPGLVVYATAEVYYQDADFRITRHRLSEKGSDVIDQIPKSFAEFNKPFVPIHELRAAVCYKLVINDEIFDYVVKGIVEERYKPRYQISLLRDMSQALPPSANPLVMGNELFYTISVVRPEKEEFT